MDETATRSDVASTKVGDMFTTDPFCFDAVRANTKLEKCITCAECEDLCDALEDILDTLHKPDNTPERLRRSSVSKVPTATAASKTGKSRKNKRATGSPTPGKGGKKKCSERSLPPNTPSPPVEGETLSMEEDISSDDSSEETEIMKVVSPVGALRSGITANGNAPSNKDYDSDSFTEVTRKRRIASIVIDAGKNATGLLEQLGKHVGAPLEGRFENGKLRVFPKSIVEHRKLQSYIAENKMRSHTFEMSHTQQLKCVIRGLPTDFDHTELMQELRGFGFDPNHISLLKNKKTNTNMPLFLVTLPKNPDNQGIFNITNIGFFRVHAEPLNKSNMPPQCYRCQEFYHHSRFCNRAPRCLKCSGGHLTSDCKKPNKAPAKCANCRGPHPANFSGCPKNLQNNTNNMKKKQPMKNVWQERALRTPHLLNNCTLLQLRKTRNTTLMYLKSCHK
ncbi:nucleic-acid-binding protein from transposon X-element [Trichonephila clavipes]|nr:nucleic-acid-binding protein from transposon X-element [Trichonephila clavipes]